MYKHGRADFIETDLRPALIESYEQQAEFIAESRDKFDRYRLRLGVVREEKEKRRLEILGEFYLWFLGVSGIIHIMYYIRIDCIRYFISIINVK